MLPPEIGLIEGSSMGDALIDGVFVAISAGMSISRREACRAPVRHRAMSARVRSQSAREAAGSAGITTLTGSMASKVYAVRGKAVLRSNIPTG